MSLKKNASYFLLFLVATLGCVEPFDIPVRNETVAFLVVDGYVNTETHSVSVTLSRAIPLSGENGFPREDGAVVSLQEENGKTYQLIAESNGVYQLSNSEFENEKRYRLHIVTSDKNIYSSKYITAKASPSIDAIAWTPQADGLAITIDSDDPANSTEFYRWEYIETWQYESPLSSEFKLEGGVPVQRTASEQLKICYRSEKSTKIILGTTIDFTENKFVGKEVVFVPATAPKIKKVYSALVRQFGLSKEAYEYWQQLSVNTESLGGLFDPQPAQLRGNIENENNRSETVIGYFDGGSVSEKRIFIRYDDLPSHLRVYLGPSACIEQTIPTNRVHEIGGFNMITYGIYEGTTLVAYAFTSIDCADCTRFGGVTQKPDFWPY
jgi:hypothetical protein